MKRIRFISFLLVICMLVSAVVPKMNDYQRKRPPVLEDTQIHARGQDNTVFLRSMTSHCARPPWWNGCHNFLCQCIECPLIAKVQDRSTPKLFPPLSFS